MAISKTERQIKWSAAVTLSIAAAGNGTSDAIAPAADELKTKLTFRAKNNGTPVSGDTVEFWLLETAGDPDTDPDTVDQYATTHQKIFLCKLDTFVIDPDIATVEFSTAGCEGYKIYAVNNSATNGITVSSSGQGVVFA